MHFHAFRKRQFTQLLMNRRRKIKRLLFGGLLSRAATTGGFVLLDSRDDWLTMRGLAGERRHNAG
ncbi:hypothetical protein CKO16_19335 [Rhodoblastus acidophilus]|nr:hypothetical protein CKO16_19335 [Rhodoblastus acidophilus]